MKSSTTSLESFALGNKKWGMNSTLKKTLQFIKTSTPKTPFLLIDKDCVENKAKIIGKWINNSRVFYAVKANPDIKLLNILHKLGIGFEISTEGELELLSRFNVSPERIISSNTIKTPQFLKRAKDFGIKYFAFDSESELEKIRQSIPGANVYVRISVPNTGSGWPLEKKYGARIEEALKMLIYSKKIGLNPVGITFHVGSQCKNIKNWEIAILKSKTLYDKAKKYGIELTLLNIGGGYPISYNNNESVPNIESIEKFINALIKTEFPDNMRIFIEPGRAVVGEAGVLVTRVIGKRKRGKENWLYLDVGVFNGLMESIGGIKYSYLTKNNNGENKKWIIAGPTCDSFDIIDRNVILSEPDIDDIILIPSSGAYTTSYASDFNCALIPETIII